MNNAELLTMLKWNLELDDSYMDQTAIEDRDAYLNWLISSAREFITREGIDLTDSYGDSNLLVMYASWQYYSRKKDSRESYMIRMLRWELNKRLMEQDATGGNPSAVIPEPPVPPDPEEDPEQEDGGA